MDLPSSGEAAYAGSDENHVAVAMSAAKGSCRFMTHRVVNAL
jgi:hypothetical protein